MKKIFKLFLALALLLPMTGIALDIEDVVISAKISGDYTYEIIDDSDSIEIINYNGNESNLKIPSEIDGMTVKRIGYGAFAECKSIETLEIPETVVTIDRNAFAQCSKMREVIIPDSIISFGNYAFTGCSSLKEVRIPSKMKTVGYGVFSNNTSLEKVIFPEGLLDIGSAAFSGCRSLKELVLPSTLLSMDVSAFANCILLEKVSFPEGFTSLGSSVFSGCLALKDVHLPNSLTGIGQSAFQGCISLEEIIIPESVTGMGYAVFTGCTSLKKVNIPSQITEIANSLFSGCSSLEEMVIPENVTTMGENVFAGCTNLKNVVLPDNISEIGNGAFSNCGSLEYVKLPSKLKVINIELFRKCANLETVIIPSSVIEIKDRAFADCEGLKSVTIPDRIEFKKLGSRLFSGSPQVVISVNRDSSGYRYAIDNDVKYRFIESGINLDKDSLTLKVGKQSRFAVIMGPYNILNNSSLTWTSSAPSIASISDDGVVTAKAVGEAVITVKNANGMSASAKVKVDDTVIPIESITLSEKSLEIRKNRSVGLKATLNPGTTTMSKVVEWESDDSFVATVSSTGSIVARNPGTTTIRATTSNGLSAECKVTVTSPLETVSLNQVKLVLEIGAEHQLRATINPVDTTDSVELIWSSSNQEVATVDQTGKITTHAKGTATITVSTTNGKTAECYIRVVEPASDVPITSVTLDQDEINLEEGQNTVLHATINPENTTNDKDLTWTSNNTEVATVDESGAVSALKEGVAVITVETVNGKTDSCTVTVSRKEIPITSVTLDQDEINLEEGQNTVLHATINPENTTNDKDLTWTSNNTEVATVDENGSVSALKEGVAVITVETVNGKTDSCTVTVNRKEIPITSVVLDSHELTLKALKEHKLTATINPENTTSSKKLTWTSNNEKVATVDANGVVSALDEGQAIIRVTAVNGVYAECKVTVYRIDKEQLEIAINNAEKYNASDYTKDSYKVLANALEQAERILADEEASQNQVDEAANALNAAAKGLLERAQTEELQVLEELMKECEMLEEGFTKEEFASMKSLLSKGEKLLADKENAASKDVANLIEKISVEKENLMVIKAVNELNKTIAIADDILSGDLSGIAQDKIEALQNERDAAQSLIENDCKDVELLKQAKDSLSVAISECVVEEVDTIYLKTMIELAETYDSDLYTEESWAVLQQEIEIAKDLLSKKATQKQIDESAERIVDSFMKLELKVNKSSLKFNLKRAIEILENKDDYKAYSIKGLDALVKEAEMLVNNDEATQDQVDKMNQKLLIAVTKARLKNN